MLRSMSGEGKRIADATPRLSSTLPVATTLWVDPSSTGETRPRGALQKSRFMQGFRSIDIFDLPLHKLAP